MSRKRMIRIEFFLLYGEKWYVRIFPIIWRKYGEKCYVRIFPIIMNILINFYK